MGYSLYYMLTARCNLNCKYCFRNSSEEYFNSELSIDDIKKMIDILYHKFNVRKITLSGGEPTFLKDNNCENFIKIIDHLRQYKNQDDNLNLKIILITNAILLSSEVIEQIKGVVDRVTVTIDAFDEEILTKLGRNNYQYTSYLDRTFSRLKELSDLGFEIKLHSVVSKVNYDSLIRLSNYISTRDDIKIIKWKFFQYMGFGSPDVDAIFSIENCEYWNLKSLLEKELGNRNLALSFKSVEKQEETLLSLLPNGKIEYFEEIDGKKVRKYSKKFFEYENWDEFLEDCKIDKQMFLTLHKN